MATAPGYSSLVDDGEFVGEAARAANPDTDAAQGAAGQTAVEIQSDMKLEAANAAADKVIRQAQEYNPANLAPQPSPHRGKAKRTAGNDRYTRSDPMLPHRSHFNQTSHTEGHAAEENDAIIDVEASQQSTPLRPLGAHEPRTPEKGTQAGWNLIPEDWTPLRFKRTPDDSFDDSFDDGVPRGKRWARNCSIILAVVVVLVGLFFAAKEYMGPLLEWVTNKNPIIGGITYFLVVVLTCFPGMMGFVIVNVGAGYIYGCWYGIVFMVPASLFGCLVAFLMLKKMCTSCTRYSKRKYKNYKQLVKLLEGPQGLKYICMIRCCPLPVGIENSMLAMSDVTTLRFILGTLIGMLPNTILYSYLGSELQSLDGVTEGKSPVGVIVAEVLLIIAISTYIGYRVNKELKKGQASLPYSPTGKTPPAALSLADFKEMEQKGEGETMPLLSSASSSSRLPDFGSNSTPARTGDESMASALGLGVDPQLEAAAEAAGETDDGSGEATRTKSDRVVSLYQSQDW